MFQTERTQCTVIAFKSYHIELCELFQSFHSIISLHLHLLCCGIHRWTDLSESRSPVTPVTSLFFHSPTLSAMFKRLFGRETAEEKAAREAAEAKEKADKEYAKKHGGKLPPPGPPTGAAAAAAVKAAQEE